MSQDHRAALELHLLSSVDLVSREPWNFLQGGKFKKHKSCPLPTPPPPPATPTLSLCRCRDLASPGLGQAPTTPASLSSPPFQPRTLASALPVPAGVFVCLFLFVFFSIQVWKLVQLEEVNKEAART